MKVLWAVMKRRGKEERRDGPFLSRREMVRKLDRDPAWNNVPDYDLIVEQEIVPDGGERDKS